MRNGRGTVEVAVCAGPFLAGHRNEMGAIK
jgi:hypothetical protein